MNTFTSLQGKMLKKPNQLFSSFLAQIMTILCKNYNPFTEWLVNNFGQRKLLAQVTV